MDEMVPIVSVIIPTFCHGHFIKETLESVFHQTFKDFEIIVINDGSTDQTEQILKPLISSGLIIYIKQSNMGTAAARNRGLAIARGKYIAFLDDDDVWPTNRLETLLKSITSEDAIVLGGLSGRIIDGVKYLPADDSEKRTFQFEDFFEGSPFSSPGQVLINAEHLRIVKGFDETIWGADDLDLYMKLSKFGKIIKTNDLSLYYRIHNENASLQTVRMMQNVKKVIIKNTIELPAHKKRNLRQNGFRFLFNYTGIGTIVEIKTAIKSVQFLNAIRNTRSLLICFLSPAIKDRTLAFTILEYCMPVRLIKAMRKSS